MDYENVARGKAAVAVVVVERNEKVIGRSVW